MLWVVLWVVLWLCSGCALGDSCWLLQKAGAGKADAGLPEIEKNAAQKLHYVSLLYVMLTSHFFAKFRDIPVS